MLIACGTEGSLTMTTPNLLSSAGSFSMYFLYSFMVVAAMQCRLPRASAGLSKLAALEPPPPSPASSRWASSMKSCTLLSDNEA
jgi:hypothetical protein